MMQLIQISFFIYNNMDSRVLFRTLGYNPILLSFVAQNVPSLATGNGIYVFKLAPEGFLVCVRV